MIQIIKNKFNKGRLYNIDSEKVLRTIEERERWQAKANWKCWGMGNNSGTGLMRTFNFPGKTTNPNRYEI